MYYTTGRYQSQQERHNAITHYALLICYLVDQSLRN